MKRRQNYGTILEKKEQTLIDHGAETVQMASQVDRGVKVVGAEEEAGDGDLRGHKDNCVSFNS